MKPGIHPSYYEDALIVCGTCGTTFRVGSTKKEIHVDVCSNCHPFYTGEQRIVDTAGQVERFMKRQAAKEVVTPKTEVKPKKEKRQYATTSSLLTRTVEPRPRPPKPPKVASGAAETANLVGEVAPVNQQAVIEGAEAPAAAPEPTERKARTPRKPRPTPAGAADATPEAAASPEISAPPETAADN